MEWKAPRSRRRGCSLTALLAALASPIYLSHMHASADRDSTTIGQPTARSPSATGEMGADLTCVKREREL